MWRADRARLDSSSIRDLGEGRLVETDMSPWLFWRFGIAIACDTEPRLCVVYRGRVRKERRVCIDGSVDGRGCGQIAGPNEANLLVCAL